MESFLSSNKIFEKRYVIAAVALLFIVLTLGAIKLNKNIVIAFDGQELEVRTFSVTVGEVLRRKGIEVHENDKVIPGLDEKLADGTRVVVHRAFQIQLVDGGQEKTMKTAAFTVKDLLQSLNIQLNELDRVEPPLDKRINKDDVIRVIRVEESIFVEEQEIPFHTIVRYNDKIRHGESKKIQEGAVGFKEVTIKVVYEDGIEVSRDIIEENIHLEASNEIIEKGTLNFLVSSRGEVRRYSRVLIMEATAYDAGFESTGKRPGDPFFGITASGTQVRPGVVAVDPNVIPLGTKLYIESMDRTPSYGFAVAEDTGGAIRGKKIDLFMENRRDALNFGRRKVKVYILE